MDQMVETYRVAIEKMFADPKNRGPKYDPSELPRIVAELAICEIQLTLDDEWNSKYEEYIKEKANISPSAGV